MLNGHSSQWCVPLYHYVPAEHPSAAQSNLYRRRFTCFRADSQTTAVSLSARTPSSFRCPPDNNGIRLCASASYDDLHCYQKSRVTPREQCLFSSCTLIHTVRNTIFKVQQTEYRLAIPLTHRLNHPCLSGSRNLQATRRMARFHTL